MKEEKGITLLSLILYMIGLILVVSMLGIMSNLFFSNTNYITENSKYIAEFNKFNMYFIEDVKKYKDVEVTNNEIRLKSDTGETAVVYTYIQKPDNSIYRNKVKICTNIVSCSFSKTNKKEEITKQIVTVHMCIKGSKLFETTNDYVLKYW